MERSALESTASPGIPARLRPWGLGLLAAIAYRAVWYRPSPRLDNAIFDPDAFPVHALLVLAFWLLFRRRDRARREGSAAAPVPALACAAGAATLFAWALHRDAPGLLMPSLALGLLAVAAWLRGGGGLAAARLPAFVLAAGVGVPRPLEDEIVWRLQRLTAEGANALLETLGREYVQSGVILHSDTHTFHVIDACSGWNGIVILCGVALVVRELFREAGARMWLPLVLAPPLAIVLNVARVAYVAASPDPEALAGVGGDHTAQGLAVVMAGAGLLYAIGLGLSAAGAGRARAPVEATRDAGAARPAPAGRWRGPAVGLLLLVVLSLLPWGSAPTAMTPGPTPDWPERRGAWLAEPMPRDAFFTGVFRKSLLRRYRRAPGPVRPAAAVDLLVAWEAPAGLDASRLFSTKRRVPGPEWELRSVEPVKIWPLDARPAALSISRRPSGEHAVVYSWILHDDGLAGTSLRALLGLERGAAFDAPPRVLVQPTAYAPSAEVLGLERARQRLDEFVLDFADRLSGL